MDIIRSLFVFDMPRVVIIRQPILAMIHRLIQLFIFSYFIIYVMWLNKGYQSFDRPVSGVAAKVKGIAWRHIPKHQNRDINGIIVLDSADYQVQPSQNAALYLITRIKHFVIQNMTTCSEADRLPDAECIDDYQCPAGSHADHHHHQLYNSDHIHMDESFITSDEGAHGIFTGKCLKDHGKCEIFGWCPTEDDYEYQLRKGRNIKRILTQPLNILEEYYGYFTDLEFLDAKNRINQRTPYSVDPFFEVVNFTVLIKNSIEFPAFNTKRRNILPWMTKSYLNDCLYNPKHKIDQYCPKFLIGDIFKFAGINANRMLKYGGVIVITINWHCDLDWPIDYCLPKYEFLALESAQKLQKVNVKNKTYRQENNPAGSSSSASNKTGIPEMIFDYSYRTSKSNYEDDDFIDEEDEMTTVLEGFSLRTSSHFGYDTETVKSRKRILMHVNGVQIIIRVTGRAGRFNLLSFSMRLGSGLALLGIATIVTDLILFHFTNDRKHYKEITCDDKTLSRLLAIAAQTSLPESRRMQMMRKMHDLQLPEENDVMPSKRKRFKCNKYFKWGQRRPSDSIFPRSMNKLIKTPTTTTITTTHISHPTNTVISSIPHSSTTLTITNTDTTTITDNDNNNSCITDNQIISDTTLTIESDTENGDTPYNDKEDCLNSKSKFTDIGGEQKVYTHL